MNSLGQSSSHKPPEPDAVVRSSANRFLLGLRSNLRTRKFSKLRDPIRTCMFTIRLQSQSLDEQGDIKDGRPAVKQEVGKYSSSNRAANAPARNQENR